MEKQSIVKGKTVKQVRKLNLSGQGLREIPTDVFEYTNLTKLVLSRNAIKRIPKEIALLKKLEVLDLTYNELEGLPAPVFKLPRLRVLAVGHNRIKKFPSQLKGSSIKELIADHNQLETLSSDVLDNITRLVIGNNPLSGQIITCKLAKLKYYDFRGTMLDNPPEEFISEECKGRVAIRPAIITPEMVANKLIYDAVMKRMDVKDVDSTNGSIFISHSSIDKEVIEEFVDKILQLGIGIPRDRIRCTSIQGMGIKNGEDMREWIHSRIAACSLAFLMISPNYKESEICLNEMGAIWALDKPVKILLLPGVDYKQMGWLEEIRQAGLIDSESALDLLFDELTDSFEIKKIASNWNRQKKKFLEYCKSALPQVPHSQKTNNHAGFRMPDPVITFEDGSSEIHLKRVVHRDPVVDRALPEDVQEFLWLQDQEAISKERFYDLEMKLTNKGTAPTGAFTVRFDTSKLKTCKVSVHSYTKDIPESLQTKEDKAKDWGLCQPFRVFLIDSLQDESDDWRGDDEYEPLTQGLSVFVGEYVVDLCTVESGSIEWAIYDPALPDPVKGTLRVIVE